MPSGAAGSETQLAAPCLRTSRRKEKLDVQSCRGLKGRPRLPRDPGSDMSSVAPTSEVRRFGANVSDEQIDDLRRRIAKTRWPSKELVDDRSQGVQLATLQALAHYWATEYDFDRVEARLNALPQFATEIAGVDIHFLHVRAKHDEGPRP